MKNIFVISNSLADKDHKVTVSVLEKIVALGFIPYINACEDIQYPAGVIFCDDIPSDIDLIVVVGGDGSVIDAAQISTQLNIPLLGVNAGKVGYLATVDPEEIELLDRLVSGEYITDEKMLLSVEKHSANGEVERFDRYAVNDVVISHDDYFGISDFCVENTHGDKVYYRADGVIVSTPQGSTAYSLSAGGPIISHNLDSIMLTPICPHSFFNRSIVYGADEMIKISNPTERSLNVSIDGRYSSKLLANECCNIFKSHRRLKVIALGESNVFSTLSKKITNLHGLV